MKIAQLLKNHSFRYLLFLVSLLFMNIGMAKNPYQHLVGKSYSERQPFFVQQFYDNFELRKDSVTYFREVNHIKDLALFNKDEELLLESAFMKLNYLSSRRYPTYLSDMNKLIKQADKLNVKHLQVRTRQALGFHYFYELNDYGKAIFHFLKSYEYVKNLSENEFPEKQEALSNIGNICYNVGYETKALYYLEEAEKLNYPYAKGLKYNIQNTKAHIYRNLGNFDKAISIHQNIYNSTKNTTFIEWNLISNYNLSKLLFDQNNFKKAKFYLNDLQIEQPEKFICEIQGRDILLANIFLTKQETANFDAKMEQLLPHYEENKICSKNKIEFLSILYSYYKIKSDYHNTLIIADQLLRSIKESNKSVQSSEVKLAIEKNNFEVLQQKEKELNRSKTITYFLNIFYVVLLISAILLFIIFYKRKQIADKKKSLENQDILLKKEQEIQQANEYLLKFKEDIIKKNKIIESMSERLKHENYRQDEVDEASLNRMVILTEDDWIRFKKEFGILHPDFFHFLRKKSPSITPALERLAALLYLGFNYHQISNTLGISKDSVTRTNRRLKNLLEISKDQDFNQWFAENYGISFVEI